MSQRQSFFAASGSVAAAAASSACCWLPLLLPVFGFTALGASAFFEQYRWISLGAAALLLGTGFYLHYFRKERCAPGEACATPTSRLRTLNRAMLWVSTALVLALALFPSYVGALFGAGDSMAAAEKRATANEKSTVALPVQEIQIPVEGMTCAGCETGVERALAGLGGVLGADARFEDGRAYVRVEAGSVPSVEELEQAIRSVGYRPFVELAGLAHPAAAQWKGTWKLEGESAEATLDVAHLLERGWIGEIDFPQERIADEPLAVTVRGDTLQFRFRDRNVVGIVDGKNGVYRALDVDGEGAAALRFERAGEPRLSARILGLDEDRP